jgi:hypothetical protein
MIWPALLIGLVSSFLLLRLFRPLLVAPWRWAWRGLVLHVAIWGAAYAALTLLLGRPWFAMAIGLAGLMLLVQVSNAKFQALREPFVFRISSTSRTPSNIRACTSLFWGGVSFS